MTPPPRVLYIERYGVRPADWRRILPRRPEPFTGQDGFFRGALHAACAVTERPFAHLARHARDLGAAYDWVIVNFKAARPKEGLDARDLAPVKALRGCGKAVFINYAAAGVLPPDAVLDPFDVVFKRELFRDLDRYPVSAVNKAKLCTTMLACPLAPAGPRDLARFTPERIGCAAPADTFRHDVVFSGADTNPLRRDVLDRLGRAGIAVSGGLQPKPGRPAPPEPLCAPRLDAAGYLAQVRDGRVNLALEGIGQFTFRHLELWCLCAFMLSSPSVREVQTPLDVREGRDYVCFEDMDDLVDKVRHYAAADAERARIARAGRRAFTAGYDFRRHGAALVRRLDAAGEGA
jgi:hypothetical protein